ncbi:low choriolytic enzyme-like [Anabas testudineus]|uniref:low choriolytic enzyme-like n=1 Tax=Anabas testudineus TaxID=64144 RepID=UPI000E455126|nr:low choriolytic enzyme-like [Anabas testudineus]
MAAIKCILGLLVLFAVSAWTEAMVSLTAEVFTQVFMCPVVPIIVTSDYLWCLCCFHKLSAGLYQDGFQIIGDIAVPINRNADPCVQRGCKWPKSSDGKVYIPYVIDNSYTSQQVDIITSSLNSFSTSTCIRFIPRTTQTNYIDIQSTLGCYSLVGFQSGRQRVSLDSAGCIKFGTVQHELIHVLGFNHEQCRSDRDQHIKILLQNVIPAQQYNFDKINTLNQGTPYDYNSVMHYGRLAFSKDNVSPTMVAIPDSNAVFGTATQMSQNDIDRINLLYCSK